MQSSVAAAAVEKIMEMRYFHCKTLCLFVVVFVISVDTCVKQHREKPGSSYTPCPTSNWQYIEEHNSSVSQRNARATNTKERKNEGNVLDDKGLNHLDTDKVPITIGLAVCIGEQLTVCRTS